jgi:hypothetical protein
MIQRSSPDTWVCRQAAEKEDGYNGVAGRHQGVTLYFFNPTPTRDPGLRNWGVRRTSVRRQPRVANIPRPNKRAGDLRLSFSFPATTAALASKNNDPVRKNEPANKGAECSEEARTPLDRISTQERH